MKKVLILEDEVSIRSFVVINLNRAGYEVIEAGTGMEALEKLKEHPDVGVAILDIMLPDIDGFEVCRNIRATDKKIGIIMLTARSQEMDKVTGLMTGADDYMTKPFSPAELTARIDALYRRIGSDTQSDSVELTQGPFVLNTRNRTLDKEGKRIKLTQVEYAIMKLFMQNPGRALSREDILTTVWGRDYDGELKIVDVNIRRLRLKIEDDTANPVFTIRSGDAFAGLIGFKSADSTTRTIEIGYWLRSEFQGRGIMTSAVQALCRLAFEEMGMERIEIRCALGNYRSNRIPQRLGFALDRVEVRGERLADGEFVDLNVYLLER